MQTNEQERLESYRHNALRQRRAENRVLEGKYGYTDAQDELDGLSLASLDIEMGMQANEMMRDGIASTKIEAIEYEVI